MKSFFTVIMLFPIFLYGQDIAISTGTSGEKLDLNDFLFINQSSVRLHNTIANSETSESTTMMGVCEKMTMEFDPSAGISGPNICAGVDNGIDLLAFSEGMSVVTSVGLGTTISSAPAFLQSISITRYTDKYSAQFRSLLISGTIIPYVEMSWNQTYNGVQQRLHVIRMEDCIINSFSGGGAGGEDRITENISIAFTKACYRNYERDNDGIELDQINTCVDLSLIDQSGCACGSF